MHDMWDFDMAEQYYRRLLETQDTHLGRSHIDTLSALHSLAHALHHQQKWAEATELFRRAVRGRRKHRALGPNHPETLSSTHCLANALSHNSDRSYHPPGPDDREATSLYEAVAAGRRQHPLLGPAHPATLRSTLSFAQGLFLQNFSSPRARVLMQQALSGHEEHYGRDHLITLSSAHVLAGLLFQQGDLEDAENLYERALAGRQLQLGSNHSDTLLTVSNLAILYDRRGELTESKRMFEFALKEWEATLEPSSLLVLDCVSNLAELEMKLGKGSRPGMGSSSRLLAAQQLWKRALAGYKKLHGPRHSSVLRAVAGLAMTHQHQGRFEEASQGFERALRGYERHADMGEKHMATMAVVNNLAMVRFSQGRMQEARQLWERALKGKESILGRGHFETLSTLSNLANSLLIQANFYDGSLATLDEAKDYLDRALAGYEDIIGHSIPMSAVGMAASLAAQLLGHGRPDQAEPYLRVAIRGAEAQNEPLTSAGDIKLLVDALENLAALRADLGDLDEAMALYMRAHARLEAHYGAAHELTVKTAKALGRVRRQKRKRDALGNRNQGQGQESSQPGAEPRGVARRELEL